ncbi:hypothetical protein [Chitinophaga nivalis]|uniref:Lipocalin-like domain-containing protein n=1 Tax=Chitinophaga nivalis TaxID=2991709 RepID=A0ABT3IRA6_9BACT|nr:hypothetical protein [Chitinophaga nivalis]MCW3464061.1 hypothetical protein [Chitinophaga nivalis]MCW3486249.1 hypothetical protein [Chitinophaga nivalis]
MKKLRIICTVIILGSILGSCNTGKTNQLLQGGKWRVYDVKVPAGDPYNNTQQIQAKDLKNGYYEDVYYQFLQDSIFIATIAGKPDSGKYFILSNGKVISVTASNGSRKTENLVSVEQLDATHFDMKVLSGDFHFILRTKKE